MKGITAEMRIRDALPLLSPAEQISLQYWAAEFGMPLREFHLGHIRTYEVERLRVVSREEVNAEVSVLLRLLESIDLGDEIRLRYEPLRDPAELSPEERAGLPERVLKYIEKLEDEIEELEAGAYRTQDRLRKANWAKWSR
jgi:hypothetical protein